MTVKASGQSALILATGLLICFLGPSLAADPSNAAANSASESTHAPVAPSTQRAHRLKSAAHAKSSKVRPKSSAAKQDAATNNGAGSSAMPPSVADANAELTPTLPVGNDTGLAARANQTAAEPAADPVVSSEQLNDLDRAMQAGTPPAMSRTMAASDTPAMAELVASSNNEPANADRTSLIGEIFIGLGVLLTLSTAVRMLRA
ncbi:hypothetical protein [Bradyrhizobium sp.]|jgi:hypothetical protein|uniref:hypothetical protein n=1 Tax=Bradyrhizobium sp. TaxID=376 RepID=UPI003C134FFE